MRAPLSQALPWLKDLPGRGDAQDAARRELEKRAYDEAKPPLTYRVIMWVVDKIQELLGKAAGVPGGRLGVLLIVLVVGLLVAVVVVRVRPSLRNPHTDELFGTGHVRTAAEHRSLAESAVARGDFAEAVRERLRAVVRQLEERGVLDPRPGRTAIEISTETARTLPALADPLRRAATTFEQIWYGGRTADASDYAVLVGVDDAVGAARVSR
ncbi:MAG: hypothetical protein JWM40_2425 [Frankiales bacterium]|nr:hypothetical protein [Frankiales bacterium]